MNNHSSDIIFTAIGVREVNQFIADCLQALLSLSSLANLRCRTISQRPSEQSSRVSPGEGQVENIYIDCFMPSPKGAVDQVALWMRVNIIRLNLFCLNQPCN